MFFAPSDQTRGTKFRIWVYQRPVTISKSRARSQTLPRTSSILQSPISGLKGHKCSLHLQNQYRAKIWNRGVSKASEQIQSNIMISNPCQEPTASSKASNRTQMIFAHKKSRQRAKIRNMGVSKTSDHIQFKIKMPNPSQGSPASSQVPNEDLKDMDVLCTFKITIES